MKNNKFLGLVVAGIGTMLTACGVRADMITGAAEVCRITGTAEYAAEDSSNAVWTPVQLHQQFKPGEIIRTAKGATVDVIIKEGFDFTFRPDPHRSSSPGPIGFPPPRGVAYIPPARQTVIRLMSGTTLKLTQLQYDNTGNDLVSHTYLDIREGTIFFNVKKLNAMSSFVMKSKVSVASIRGTSGYDSANGDTGIFSGSEEVTTSYTTPNGTVQSATQIVSSGQSLSCEYQGGGNGGGGANGGGGNGGGGNGGGSNGNTGNTTTGGLPDAPPTINQQPVNSPISSNIPTDPGSPPPPPAPKPTNPGQNPTSS